MENKDISAVCPACGATSESYDELTEMFACPQCHNLFDKPPEEKKPKKKEAEVPKPVKEEIPREAPPVRRQPVRRRRVYEGEDLNVFSCILIILVLFVPVLNFLALYVIGNSEIKQAYKKCFTALFFIIIVTVCSGLLYLIVNVKDTGRELLLSTAEYYYNKASFDAAKIKLDKINVGPFTSLSFDEILSGKHTTIKDEEDGPLRLNERDFGYLNDAQVSGSVLLSIVDSYKDYECSMLVQTNKMRERSGDYRNFGLRLSSATRNSSDNYIITSPRTRDHSFYLDDYDGTEFLKYDDLTNKKYVFFINEENYFLCRFIYDKNDALIGFIFSELEETKK